METQTIGQEALDLIAPCDKEEASSEGSYIDSLINALSQEAQQVHEFFFIPMKGQEKKSA